MRIDAIMLERRMEKRFDQEEEASVYVGTVWYVIEREKKNNKTISYKWDEEEI